MPIMGVIEGTRRSGAAPTVELAEEIMVGEVCVRAEFLVLIA